MAAGRMAGRRGRRRPRRPPAAHPVRARGQVVTMHDLFFLSHPERTTAEIRRDYPALAASHARRADAVITVSQYTRRQVIERLGVDGRTRARLLVGRPDVGAAGPGTERAGRRLRAVSRHARAAQEPRRAARRLRTAARRAAGTCRRCASPAVRGPAPSAWLDRIRTAAARRAGAVRRLRARRRARGALRRRAHAGAAVARRRLRPAGARSDVGRRAGGRVERRRASGGGRRRGRPVRSRPMPRPSPTRLARLATDEAWARDRAAAGLARARTFTWDAAARALRRAYDAAVAHRSGYEPPRAEPRS